MMEMEVVLVMNGFRLEEIRNMKLSEILTYIDIIREMMDNGTGR